MAYAYGGSSQRCSPPARGARMQRYRMAERLSGSASVIGYAVCAENYAQMMRYSLAA